MLEGMYQNMPCMTLFEHLLDIKILCLVWGTLYENISNQTLVKRWQTVAQKVGKCWQKRRPNIGLMSA